MWKNNTSKTNTRISPINHRNTPFFQVITFIDILARYTPAKSILIVVPINTIQNWASEFNRWCPIDDPTIGYKRPYQLYILNETSRKYYQRAEIIQNWFRTGGALLIGYEMFRLMLTKKGAPASTPRKITTHPEGITDLSSPSTTPKSNSEEETSLERMEGKAKEE